MCPDRNHGGDDGNTGLLGENRLPKFHPRIETLGDLDEASSALGLARATCQDAQTRTILVDIQRDLYAIMTEIATTPGNLQHFISLNPMRVDWLESQSEAISASVPRLDEFILPGDSLTGAALDMARTITRRAERRVADLFAKGEIKNRILLQYLNRLSSLCFMLELRENQSSGCTTTLAKK